MLREQASEHEGRGCRKDLVWDQGRSGTVTGPGGLELRIGDGGEWTADDLFSVALQAALMTTFVEAARAQGLEVLGYVSGGEVELEPRRRFRLSPCVVVASERDGRLARTLLEESAASTPIFQLLGDHWELSPHVVTTRGAGS